MDIREAQREMREVYLGGSAGTLVSAVLWTVSSALSTWRSPKAGGWALVIGGMFIYPALQLVLKAMGRRASVRPENPLAALALQTAVIIPLCLPVVGAAALHRPEWFYPGVMVVVGAHYLPFVTLYGMRLWYALGIALLVAGLMLGAYGPRMFALGGWVGAALLAVFTGVFAVNAKREGGAA